MSHLLHSRRNAGFTLVELTISVIIIAFIIAMAITTDNQNDRLNKQAVQARNLDIIGEALSKFRAVNFYIPCPGNATLATSDPNAGKQADSDPEQCHNGDTISSNNNTSGNDVFCGSVPWVTLGLTLDIALDAQKNLLTYCVDKKATNPCNWTGNRGTYGLTDTNKLNVKDESGTTIDESVLAVVFSHGANQHGAYNIAGVRQSAGITNEAELENCMCDSSADPVSHAELVVTIQRNLPTDSGDAAATGFDDTGKFFPKSFFYTYAEKTI